MRRFVFISIFALLICVTPVLGCYGLCEYYNYDYDNYPRYRSYDDFSRSYDYSFERVSERSSYSEHESSHSYDSHFIDASHDYSRSRSWSYSRDFERESVSSSSQNYRTSNYRNFGCLSSSGFRAFGC